MLGERVPPAYRSPKKAPATIEVITLTLNLTLNPKPWMPGRRLQQPTKVANTADAPLRYTGRSSGNCLDFAFPRQPRTTQTTTAAATAQAAQAPRRCGPAPQGSGLG